MPGSIGPIKGTTFAKSDNVVVGRVLGSGGTAITQASLSTLTYVVTREETDGSKTTTGSGTLIISSCVYNTLQTGGYWGDPKVDNKGYNVACRLPASCFETALLRHIITLIFTDTGGNVFRQTWETHPAEVE